MQGTGTPAKAEKRASGHASRRLTPMQERFVQEYLIDLSPAKAAIRAGYSPKTADKQGSQVLALPWVQERIAAGKDRRAARVEVDSDFVLRRLLDEVNADAADLYDPETGELLPVPAWPEVWRRGLVSTIRTTKLYGRGEDRATEIGIQTDVVLVDRARRLELLGKHIKVNAFADRVQVGLDSPLQELFKQIAGSVIRPRDEIRTIEHQPGPDEGED